MFDNQLQYKEAEGSSFRDGSYADTPSTPKVVNYLFIPYGFVSKSWDFDS